MAAGSQPEKFTSRAATDKFIALLSANYGEFYRMLWRILSREYGWIMSGLWENYVKIMRELCKDYGNIIAELLQRCSNFGACRDRTRTRDKLESCFGSSESNSCQLEKVSRPGIEPMTASGSNSESPKCCSDRESNSGHLEMCSRTGFMARFSINLLLRSAIISP